MTNEVLTNPQAVWICQQVTGWLHAVPMAQTLIILMGIDILMGTMVAVSKKRLNSTTSWRGMMRKSGSLILVATGSVLQPFTSGIPGLAANGAGPIANLIAIGFIIGEFQSILENAGALGIPMPPFLKEVLSKLRDSKEQKAVQKTPTVKLNSDIENGPKVGMAFLVVGISLAISGCAAIGNAVTAVQNFAENQPIKFRYCQKLRDGQEVCGTIGAGQPFTIEARGRDGKDIIDLH